MQGVVLTGVFNIAAGASSSTLTWNGLNFDGTAPIAVGPLLRRMPPPLVGIIRRVNLVQLSTPNAGDIGKTISLRWWGSPITSPTSRAAFYIGQSLGFALTTVAVADEAIPSMMQNMEWWYQLQQDITTAAGSPTDSPALQAELQVSAALNVLMDIGVSVFIEPMVEWAGPFDLQGGRTVALPNNPWPYKA